MAKFITVPIVDKTGKKLEDTRVNTDTIGSYRKWMTKDNEEQSVLFIKDGSKLIVDVAVFDVDRKLGKDVS